MRVLFGVRIRDVNFAFKLCRRRVFDHVKLVSEGSFIDAELIVRATKYGYKVVQFGVDYFRTRGVSTLSSPTVIVKILREMPRAAPRAAISRPRSDSPKSPVVGTARPVVTVLLLLVRMLLVLK